MARSSGTPDATSRANASVNRFTRFVRAQLPTLLVLLTLAGIAYLGYRTEWKIPGFSAPHGSAENEEAGANEHGAKARARVVPPDSTDKECPLGQTRVEFPSAEAIRRAGIRVAPVEERPLAATLSAPAEVDYDPTRIARLSSPVPGRAWRVEKEVGQRVRKGDVLVLLDAVRVGEVKAEFLQSLTQLDLRTQTLEKLRLAGSGIAQQQVREAEAAVRDARVRLFNTEQALLNLGLPIPGKDLEKLPAEQLTGWIRFLGLPETVVQTLPPETATSNLLPLKAPFDGVVAERQITPGEVVDPTKTLFVVADLSRVWVVMSIRQEDVDKLALGQEVAFQPDGHTGEIARGNLSWVSTTVDEKTRAIRARAVVDNPKEHLPARTFGIALIALRNTPKAVVVPGGAVQRDDRCRFVFVRVTDQVFQVREVRLGVSNGGFMEILEGLRPGEIVATTGSFVLKSEVIRGRLGEHAD